jgi:hypothetical protein
VDGAHHGLGNKGLGKIGRVVKGEEVLVKLLGGTHGWLFCGGGEEQHRGRADDQKVGGRRAREKIDEVEDGRERQPSSQRVLLTR